MIAISRAVCWKFHQLDAPSVKLGLAFDGPGLPFKKDLVVDLLIDDLESHVV